MTTYVCTGPSRLSTFGAVQVVEETTAGLIDGDRFISGGAHGADSVFAAVALESFPDAEHLIMAPAAPWNEELRELGIPTVVAWQLERRPKDYSEAYLARNDLMVLRLREPGDELVAFLWSESFYRSGEWATLNRARKRGKRAQVALLPRD